MTLLFILSSGLLDFFVIALCDMLISFRNDVGIGIASVVDFVIFGFVFPFILAIIGFLIFSGSINVTFSSKNLQIK